MSRIQQAIDLAIGAVGESFLPNPANYSDERALAEAVRLRANAVLSPTLVDSVSVVESSGAQGDITDHEA